MLLVGILGAGLASVAAFFLALAAGDAFAASGVLLDGAGGATALFFFVGEDRLAEHVEGDAVDGFSVFLRLDGCTCLPHSPKPIAYVAGNDNSFTKLVVSAMGNRVDKFFKLCHFHFCFLIHLRFVLRIAKIENNLRYSQEKYAKIASKFAKIAKQFDNQ